MFYTYNKVSSWPEQWQFLAVIQSPVVISTLNIIVDKIVNLNNLRVNLKTISPALSLARKLLKAACLPEKVLWVTTRANFCEEEKLLGTQTVIL